jgi:hypothetical protein
VKIAQPGANIDIARRGPDRGFGADSGSSYPIATPSFPPEFYQFSAPTPPMFHAPPPPAPRKARTDPAPRGPDIFPAFVQMQEEVRASASKPTASKRTFKPQRAIKPRLIPKFARHRHTPAATAAPATMEEVERTLAALQADLNELRGTQSQSQSQSQPQPQPTQQPPVTPAAVSAAPASPVSEADYLQALQSHVQSRLHSEYSALSRAQQSLVRAADARAAGAARQWQKLQAKHDRQSQQRYDALQQQLLDHPYAEYQALHSQYDAQRHAEPYARYDALHRELYGVPPPPPPQGAADGEPRFQQQAVEQELQAEEGEDSDLGYSTGAPPAADAELQAVEEAEAAVVEMELDQTEHSTSAAAPVRHMPLLYPSVRAALRQQQQQ